MTWQVMLSARRPPLPCAGSAWPGLAPPTTRTGPGWLPGPPAPAGLPLPRLHLVGKGRPAGRCFHHGPYTGPDDAQEERDICLLRQALHLH